MIKIETMEPLFQRYSSRRVFSPDKEPEPTRVLPPGVTEEDLAGLSDEDIAYFLDELPNKAIGGRVPETDGIKGKRDTGLHQAQPRIKDPSRKEYSD